MNLKNFLFTCILFFNVSIQSQSVQKIDSAYNDYFKKVREIPHLHLNKTSFLQGENIWFQTYIFEQNSQKLHNPTSNLYVSLYDESGKLKKQKLIHIQNGIGKGNFKIDSSFTNAAYFIKASTNWMRNFNEDVSFSQKIIVVKNRETSAQKIKKDSFFDFQLFPEGGNIVANTFNRIGILLKDGNNKGIEISKGTIKDETGKEIDVFKTNSFGLGEAFLPFKENQKYIFEAILPSGERIEVITPVVKKLGITLNLVNDEKNQNFIVNILTNSKTLQNIRGKNYKIWLHNTRKYIHYDLKFDESKKVYAFILEKSNILKGINIITVFNEENRPILERVFYNETNNLLTNSIKASITSKINDSLKVTLTNNHSEKLFISGSFLPSLTKAYRPDKNIASSILLNPYVKGNIENAAYYFNEQQKNRLVDLDLLLLTQGWSKYDWNQIFTNPPSENFKFENGIDITFAFNRKILPSQQVQMQYVDDENNENYELTIPLNKNNHFTLENSFITENTMLHFGIKSGENLYKISPSISYTNTFIYDNINKNQIKELVNTPNEFSNFSYLFDDYIMLDDVIIKSKLQDQKKLENSGLQMKVISKYYNYIESFYFGADKYGFLNNRSGNAWNVNFGINNEFQSIVSTSNMVKFRDYSSLSEPIFTDKKLYDPSTIVVPFGFSKTKEYYAPKYPSFSKKAYLDYGAIFWKAGIEIEANSTFEITIPDNNIDSILLNLEGTDELGKLLVKQIQLKK